jgi:NAD(P)-dependent dehydrogenase (short-subunit alcohol dehydrogenase family)
MHGHHVNHDTTDVSMNQTSELFRLDGQVALVTGGAGLYGRHICRALAEAGAHVVIASRDRAACDVIAGELDSDGLAASTARLDQSDEASIEAFCADVGPIDVLINNAVFRRGGSIDDVDPADLRATAEVNYVGLMLLTRLIAEQMKERGGGSVVNIASIYGVVGPQFAVYEGTDIVSPAFYAFEKGGMVNLTRYLAAHYGPSGIRVNCVSPGGLATPEQPAAFVDAYTKRTPLGRLAGPDDIKGPIVFLASQAASYVNGVNLMVDGGWTAV